ncbi:MAG: YkgJ family cysteine cluster protein [Desulfobacterales bacterium]
MLPGSQPVFDPYDVVRLKAHFKLSSAEFLAAYTTRHIGPQTGLPVVTITPADRFTRMCPFVTAAGCRVYQNRPSSCRMYPLIRVVRRARADGGKQFSMPFCMNLIARDLISPGS